ncbi:Putative heterokaryon incompatibility [Septoria linicola]|uniref:Heterokaryon incompatibility n=1 Tax=Septoria linicola TaxID=215465 RepID=A0A9Q9B0P5_9PEZI|nr:putative heterokaryon incompatibility [Septoria linicola]USW59557.1 Putative heterokaryon incompatibility [Septoria linicola]
MRLLNVYSLKFADFRDNDRPNYVIASHRWSESEATYKDVRDGQNKNKAGYEKVLAFARFVKEKVSPIEWLWIDTCCINQDSEAELSYSINLMFNWYRGSELCLVYLEDIKDKEGYQSSVWFTRGWTLQELLAPRLVVFATKKWQIIGNKGSLFHRCDSISAGADLARGIATLTGIQSAF